MSSIKDTISFENAIKATAQASLATHDIAEPLNNWQCTVTDENRLALTHKPSGQPYTLTNWAFSQLCTKSGLSTTLRKHLENPRNIKGDILFERTKQDTEWVRDAFNLHIFHPERFDQEKPYLIRTNTEDNTIRAFLSEKYAVVNNVWMLEKILENLGNREVLATRWRGNADTLYGELIFPEEKQTFNDSDYYPGISIGNSEIGQRRVSLDAFVYRLVCTNGMIERNSIGGRQNWKHLGTPKLKDIERWITSRLETGFDPQMQLIERVQNAISVKIPEIALGAVFSQILSNISIDFNSQKKAWKYIDHERGVSGSDANSLFGIHSAVTRYVQTLPNEEWVKTEENAEKILTYSEDKVSRLIANAANVDISHLAV
jgi:hypothetical protein